MIQFTDEEIDEINDTYIEDVVKNINMNEINQIYSYLLENGIYFARDVILEFLPLCNNAQDFRKRFERLKKKLGNNYVQLLENDYNLLNVIYED